MLHKIWAIWVEFERVTAVQSLKIRHHAPIDFSKDWCVGIYSHSGGWRSNKQSYSMYIIFTFCAKSYGFYRSPVVSFSVEVHDFCLKQLVGSLIK